MASNTWTNRHREQIEGIAGDMIDRKKGQVAYWKRYGNWKAKFQDKHGKWDEKKSTLWFAQYLAEKYPDWPMPPKHQEALDREARRLAKEAERG